MISELKEIACRELWVVKGKTINGPWQFPVWVDFFQGHNREFAKCTPAVGLNAEQALHLVYHFSIHNVWKKTESFLIDRHFLPQLAERVTGVVPEYYFRWPGSTVPLSKSMRRLRIAKDDLNDDDISEETEDFIEFIHKRRSVDRNVLRLAIDMICREAPYWLTQKKKPIDLGFVRIFALPYRVNWKEILLAKFRDIAWVFNSNKETKDNALREARFNEHLCRLEMLSIDRTKMHIHWTLEAVPTKQWEKDAAEIEMTKQASGDTVYIKMYEKLVAALAPRILEVFTSYVQKVSRPFPEICKGSKPGSKKMVPYRGEKKMLPKIGGNIPVHVTVSGQPQSFNQREKDVAVLVRPTIASVPQLPDIPSTDVAVREPILSSQMEKPKDGNAGTDRVPVLDASEVQNLGSELLALRDRSQDEPLANEP